MTGPGPIRHAGEGWHPDSAVSITERDEILWTPAYAGVTEEVARA